jgi:hypothetical protein
MIETLLGGLLGGAFRLAPELLKWLDRQGERRHELAMQDKALEFERVRGAQRMAEIGAAGDAAFDAGAIEALRQAIGAQSRPSGVRWADALSTSVRPVITYGLMGLYCAVKAAIVATALHAGVGWETTVLRAWSEADQALWAGVLNFWFLSRVWERRDGCE